MKNRAYCKINLALDVVGKREDGYHELRMIMVPIDFYDKIEIIKNDEMIFECDKKTIRFNENNTIVKAINIMKEEFNIDDNYIVRLNKQIPMQAGLAGGSTDGAAVIRIMNKMYNLRLNEEKIKELCLKIGADVLFNYYNRPALVEGIGDKLSFIDIKDDYYVLILKPRGGVSTKECYSVLDANSCVHPDVDLILEKLKNGEDIEDLLMNSLENTALSLCKDIKKAKEELLNKGAKFAMVSGSGSSVFTISKSKDFIEDIKNRVNRKHFFIRSGRILKEH